MANNSNSYIRSKTVPVPKLPNSQIKSFSLSSANCSFNPHSNSRPLRSQMSTDIEEVAIRSLITDIIDDMINIIIRKTIILDIADSVARSLERHSFLVSSPLDPVDVDTDINYLEHSDNIDKSSENTADNADNIDKSDEHVTPPSSNTIAVPIEILPLHNPTCRRFVEILLRGIDLKSLPKECTINDSELVSQRLFLRILNAIGNLEYENHMIFTRTTIVDEQSVIVNIDADYNPARLRCAKDFSYYNIEFIQLTLFGEFYNSSFAKSSGRFKVWSIVLSNSLTANPYASLQFDPVHNFRMTYDSKFRFLKDLIPGTTGCSTLAGLEMLLRSIIRDPAPYVELPFPDLAIDFNDLENLGDTCPFCSLLANVIAHRSIVILCKFILLQLDVCYHQPCEHFHYVSPDLPKFIPHHILVFMACFGGRELSSDWLKIWTSHASCLHLPHHHGYHPDLGYICTFAPYQISLGPVVRFHYEYFCSDSDSFLQIRKSLILLSSKYSLFIQFLDLLHIKFLNGQLPGLKLFEVIGDLVTIFNALRYPCSDNVRLLDSELSDYAHFVEFTSLFRQYACLIISLRVPNLVSSSPVLSPLPKRIRLVYSSSLLFSTPDHSYTDNKISADDNDEFSDNKDHYDT